MKPGDGFTFLPRITLNIMTTLLASSRALQERRVGISPASTTLGESSPSAWDAVNGKRQFNPEMLGIIGRLSRKGRGELVFRGSCNNCSLACTKTVSSSKILNQ